MASRDIANMHLFLDLKKKFPDFPDDTIRNYVPLYAEDPDNCISLLQQEGKNHYNPSQPFSDFRLPDGRINSRNDDTRISRDTNEYFLPDGYEACYNFQNMYLSSKKIQIPSGRSTSHAGVIHAPKSPNSTVPYKPEARSAPVMAGFNKPFSNIYQQIPVSSHTFMCQSPNDEMNNNQMIFSTTKEHIIQSTGSHETTAYLPISAEAEPSKKHAVKLNITPSFPFQQQHNVYNSSICATTSHSSRPGRHMTSLNFQLQPHSSDQYPLEISTIPTNIGDPCNSRDFGSHVQVSVGAQGATFTALRLQRPTYTQSTSSLSPQEESPYEYPSSSQTHDSKFYMLSNSTMQPSTRIESFHQSPAQDLHQKGRRHFPVRTAQYDSMQNYHLSPDYILAVKNHQIAQLEFIHSELEREKSICSKLKSEVNKMEQEVTQQKASKASLFNAMELSKIRDENRNLRIECNCLLMEVDMFNAGQIPLGVTDEDFYSNIFTGPNGAITSPLSQDCISNSEKSGTKLRNKSPFQDDEDDEQNCWKCKKCTFVNHPALEKCEICEMPKNTEYIQLNSDYSPGTCVRFVSTPKNHPHRSVGSVQISVTRRVPSSSKSVKLHLTHRQTR